MKKKEKKELHSKTIKELEKLISKVEKELVLLKTDFGAGKLKDVCQLKKKRQDLARVKTILKSKELEAEK